MHEITIMQLYQQYYAVGRQRATMVEGTFLRIFSLVKWIGPF